MANWRGPLTLVFLLTVVLVAVTLALAGDEDARADDVALARSMRSARWRGGRRGNEEVAVDSSDRRWGRRGNRGNRRNNGAGRRRGPGRGGRGRGRGRGRGGREPFSRRERRLIGRLTTASGQFALQMYNVLKQEHQEMIFSPHSIHMALTMTYMGARERTAKQMMKVLGLKRLRNNKAHMAYAALVNSLTNAGNVTLNVANAVYVKPNLPVEEAFRSGLQTMYTAAFDHFDFDAEGGPEAPINAWVAMKTEDKIQNLLIPGIIGRRTAMVILNAIYFKGGWKNKFDAESTSEQTFYRDDRTTATVQMMTRTGEYNYTRADDLSAHIVELPYQDGRFSMYVILPVTRNALSDVEESLSLDALNNHLQNMRSVNMRLDLPKFKTESKFSLKETLRSMRMILPFSQRARFSGICTVTNLRISDVIHQAVIEVSEEGTEAAAATAVILVEYAAFNPLQVRADHPFIYAVRDNLSQAWLFMGKYSAQQ